MQPRGRSGCRRSTPKRISETFLLRLLLLCECPDFSNLGPQTCAQLEREIEAERQHSRELLAAQEGFERVARECGTKIANAEDAAAVHQESSRRAEEEREKAEMRARGKQRELAMQRLDLQV